MFKKSVQSFFLQNDTSYSIQKKVDKNVVYTVTRRTAIVSFSEERFFYSK